MKQFFNTQLEIGPKVKSRQGVITESVDALVTIETSDEDLHDRIVSALTHIEVLEV